MRRASYRPRGERGGEGPALLYYLANCGDRIIELFCSEIGLSFLILVETGYRFCQKLWRYAMTVCRAENKYQYFPFTFSVNFVLSFLDDKYIVYDP